MDERISWPAIAVGGMLALLILAGIVAVFASRPAPVEIVIVPPAPTATRAPSATPAPITVYVTGAVSGGAQTVQLPYASRATDAIAAAGGMTHDADAIAVNLAAILQDGDQVHVPLREQAGRTVLATQSVPRQIRINHATAEELESLPGVGPALAQRIIAYRETVGAFMDFDDLDRVSGIGAIMIENLAGLVTFD
jgi:competence protein ComEA